VYGKINESDEAVDELSIADHEADDRWGMMVLLMECKKTSYSA
jgi:hypothetical protein